MPSVPERKVSGLDACCARHVILPNTAACGLGVPGQKYTRMSGGLVDQAAAWFAVARVQAPTWGDTASANNSSKATLVGWLPKINEPLFQSVKSQHDI